MKYIVMMVSVLWIFGCSGTMTHNTSSTDGMYGVSEEQARYMALNHDESQDGRDLD